MGLRLVETPGLYGNPLETEDQEKRIIELKEQDPPLVFHRVSNASHMHRIHYRARSMSRNSSRIFENPDLDDVNSDLAGEDTISIRDPGRSSESISVTELEARISALEGIVLNQGSGSTARLDEPNGEPSVDNNKLTESEEGQGSGSTAGLDEPNGKPILDNNKLTESEEDQGSGSTARLDEPNEEPSVDNNKMTDDDESEEDTLGLDGMDSSERMKCMRDKHTKPHGAMKSHLGQAFPSELRVDDLNSRGPLNGASCDEPCGVLNESPQPDREIPCVREVSLLLALRFTHTFPPTSFLNQVPKLIHFIWLDHPLPKKYAANIAGRCGC